MPSSIPLALASLTTIAALGTVPRAVGAQDLAAAAPEGARVHHFDLVDWREPLCSGASEVAFDVPAGHWVEYPVGWIAVDHATAIQNWDCMGFEISTGGRVLPVPQGLNWDLSPVRFECPNDTVEGMALSPVIYLPPVDGERTYRVRYLFRAEVNDGWRSFAKGSDLTVQVTFRVEAPEAEGGGR